MVVWIRSEDKDLQAKVTRIFSRSQRFYFDDGIKRIGQWVLWYTTGFGLHKSWVVMYRGQRTVTKASKGGWRLSLRSKMLSTAKMHSQIGVGKPGRTRERPARWKPANLHWRQRLSHAHPTLPVICCCPYSHTLLRIPLGIWGLRSCSFFSCW